MPRFSISNAMICPQKMTEEAEAVKDGRSISLLLDWGRALLEAP